VDQKIDGGPSVLYDAVVLLVSAEGAELLANEATARDFIADAFAHLKFIGHTADALPLLEKAGVADSADAGVIELAKRGDAATFVKACRPLRIWDREPNVKAAMPPS
jgi:catalase